jgi:hypothetical protein
LKTQVNFIPATIDVAPAFTQAAPADGEAAKTEVGANMDAATMTTDA